MAEKAKQPAKAGGVNVSLDKVQEETLDSLRGHVSRHDYLQRLVNVHLEAANPNATHVEDQDLPGNEREVARLTGKVPKGASKVRPVGVPGNEEDNFVPGHVPPIIRPDDELPGNERPNFVPTGA